MVEIEKGRETIFMLFVLRALVGFGLVLGYLFEGVLKVSLMRFVRGLGSGEGLFVAVRVVGEFLFWLCGVGVRVCN